MNTIDLIIFIAYCLLILCVGLFVSRGRKGDERDAGDYFLAGRGLASVSYTHLAGSYVGQYV